MKKQIYHLIGICGASMSSLALWLKKRGCIVQGSDLHLGKIGQMLQSQGITVYKGHCKNNIKNSDIVVYSSAIKNNPELNYALKKNLTVLTRAELLEIISKHYKNVIAVSGAHGKTTTTALIYNCLKCADKNPTLHLGGIIKGQESGLVFGDYEYFVTEACEYQNNFLHLKPTIGVILNVEKEHLDFFKTYKNIKKSFETFAINSKSCVINKKISIKTPQNSIFFNDNSSFYAKNIKKKSNGHIGFDCYFNNEFYYHFDLSLVGRHNVYNALAVITVCNKLGIDKKYIYQGLNQFSGIKRRYEFMGNVKRKIFLVHDYAHHPTEIKKTINATRQIVKYKKLLVVFQPHTYSRTKTLMNKFVEIFFNLDDVVIISTYSAREKFDKDGSAKTLYNKIKENNNHAIYCANFITAQNYIETKIQNGWAVLILGAGDIDILAENLSKLC